MLHARPFRQRRKQITDCERRQKGKEEEKVGKYHPVKNNFAKVRKKSER